MLLVARVLESQNTSFTARRGLLVSTRAGVLHTTVHSSAGGCDLQQAFGSPGPRSLHRESRRVLSHGLWLCILPCYTTAARFTCPSQAAAVEVAGGREAACASKCSVTLPLGRLSSSHFSSQFILQHVIGLIILVPELQGLMKNLLLSQFIAPVCWQQGLAF